MDQRIEAFLADVLALADACFIEKPPRFGASNGRMEYVVAAIG